MARVVSIEFRKTCRLLPALLFLLGGCASLPDGVGDRENPSATFELASTPFYPQEQFQCGPAALATVLAASGVDVDVDELAGRVYLPGRKGSLQLEMIAATRASGRLPYVLDPSLKAIEAEIDAGRPVVVLQNLGVSMIPRWHYAVVVGFDGRQDAVVLRSGTDKRRLTPAKVFLKTWSRGDFWALTVVEPGDLPSNVDRARYFESIAAL